MVKIMEKIDCDRTGVKIRKKTLKNIVLLLPFFEPMLFGFLEEKGINIRLWGTIGNVFLLMRIAIVAITLFKSFRLLIIRRLHLGKSLTLLVINVFMWGVSSFITHTSDLRLWVNIIQNIGFILLCSILIDESENDFFKASIAVFGVLSSVGVASIVLHPLGYFNAKTTNDALYFLGGKNGSFPYYFSLFFCVIAYYLVWKRKKPRIAGWILVTIGAALICHSSNSVLCLLLIWGCLVLAGCPPTVVKKINPKMITIIIIVFITTIYIGNISSSVTTLLGRIGRDSTFSGRDVLWSQALSYITKSPLWGVGTNAKFILRDLRDAGHAHSQYLHRLALHGLIPFSFFVMSIIAIYRKGDKIRNKYNVHIIELLMSVYLLHMAFDTYPYYYFILMIVITDRSLDKLSERIRIPRYMVQDTLQRQEEKDGTVNNFV